jgi:NAD-specific glutamate dehydrogenase
VLAAGADGETPAALVARWEGANRDAMERAARLLGELRAAPAPDLAMLSVGLRELRNLG